MKPYTKKLILHRSKYTFIVFLRILCILRILITPILLLLFYKENNNIYLVISILYYIASIEINRLFEIRKIKKIYKKVIGSD